MLAIELACVAILTLFVVVRTRVDERPAVLLRRLALMALASWIGEETCIRFYGFYFYSPEWSARIGHVPLLVPLIWPVVIQSAYDLARRLAPGRAALFGGALVLFDASLIEPIAVQARLWFWTEPGLFSVPIIGVLGWAFFGAACMLVFELRRDRAPTLASDALVLVAAPVATHLLLNVAWWGALRWMQGELPPWPAVGAVWIVSLALTARAIQTGARRLVPRVDIALRIPAAGFFFVLLALRGSDIGPLVAYALAFAPPYLALTRLRDDPAGG